MKSAIFAAALAVLASAALPAGAADDIASKVISTPSPKAFGVNGLPGSPDVRKADPKEVQGGQYLRVDVPKKGVNTWDITVSVPITKPIKAGDQLIMVFWARLEAGENGATTASLPYNDVQLAGPPYTAIFAFPADITKDWARYHGEGVAQRDYKAGEANVSIQLATAKQVVDIGPVFVLDMGPAAAGQ
jgi:hypothetical protein